jgi:hypothetical protein
MLARPPPSGVSKVKGIRVPIASSMDIEDVFEGQGSDAVQKALNLWTRCKNASKANPKKGPAGRLGKGRIKKMSMADALKCIPKLEKKLSKLS